MPQVTLSLKEIYEQLCLDCKKALRDLLKEKIADQAVKDALEEKSD